MKKLLGLLLALALLLGCAAAEEAAAVMLAEKCRTAERLHILKEDKTL